MKLKVTCVDLGNTNFHCGSFIGSELVAERTIATVAVKADPRRLASVIEEISPLDKSPGHAAFCSVAPSSDKLLTHLLQSRFQTVFELNTASCIGLAISNDNPEEVGTDRLANAMAVQSYHGTPAIVIDLGTATTFDVVGMENSYEGGVIAPGLNLMTKYLAEQTALLPKLDPDLSVPENLIGQSTREAMQLGCSLGFPSMIEGILIPLKAEVAKREGKEPMIILTGGSANELKQSLKADWRVDPLLTLRGLLEAFRRDRDGH